MTDHGRPFDDVAREAAKAARDEQRGSGPRPTRSPVPPNTEREIAAARDLLREASNRLSAAARRIKIYSSDSAVIALHIEQQVGSLTDKVEDLLEGLEIIR